MTENKKTSRLRYFVPPIILITGLLIMVGMVSSKKKPKREKKEFSGILVQVMNAELESRNVPILSNGTVKPRQQISLLPQISGKVEWVDPDFLSGGVFNKGDTLLRIEQIDYLLAVQQAEAAVAQAEYGHAVAQANADIAVREWEIMRKSQEGLSLDKSSPGSKPDALVLHEPQLKQAEANLASAKASLERALLNLERTVLLAPFDCRIREEFVDPGQLVGLSTLIATLYSVDMVEIEVGLSLYDIAWIEIPGSPVEVRLNINGTSYKWPGRIDRSLGVLDEQGRLAKVVVQVDDPFVKRSKDSPELSIGTFVEVEIIGKRVDNIIAIPRKAVRENNTVWIASENETLDIRDVTIKRLTPSEALISKGIRIGEKIVLTPITAAANGLKLRSELLEGME